MDQQKAKRILECGEKINHCYDQIDKIQNIRARATKGSRIMLCPFDEDYPHIEVSRENNVLPAVLDILKEHCDASIKKCEQEIAGLVKKE